MLGFFDKYPYTDFHELNLDWLLKAVRELAAEIKDFEIVNQFTYEGDWDITKQYKKFAIVTVNGTEGYISLQAVPSGVDITNGDYWAMIADYTAVIGGLGARILALENKVNDLETRIGIDYESVVWIGDSYTSAGSLGSDVDKRFSTLVSSYLGLTEHNYAVGGTGYKYGSTPYTTQVANAVADFVAQGYDQTKVKYCFVIGNRNDADASYGWSEYATAIDNVLNTLSNFYTNAQLIVIPALWDAKPCKELMIRYAGIIQERCQLHNNVTFFDNAWTWLQGHENEILYQNGADVHPNVVGHQRLASHILNCLDGSNYSFMTTYEFTPDSVAAGVSDFYGQIKIVNNIAYFKCRFKTSASTISGSLFSYTLNSLAASNLLIINTQVYAHIENRANSTNYPKCTINQTITKTDDTTGSITTSAYVYAHTDKFDTANWNWIEFSVPYGIQRITYN